MQPIARKRVSWSGATAVKLTRKLHRKRRRLISNFSWAKQSDMQILRSAIFCLRSVLIYPGSSACYEEHGDTLHMKIGCVMAELRHFREHHMCMPPSHNRVQSCAKPVFVTSTSCKASSVRANLLGTRAENFAPICSQTKLLSKKHLFPAERP